MISTLLASDFNNQILQRCPPPTSTFNWLDGFSVLPQTSALSPRQRLPRQFLKDKPAVCAHANDARPSGWGSQQGCVYRGRTVCLGWGRRLDWGGENASWGRLSLFPCWSSKKKKVLVTAKQFNHCFDNSDTPTHSGADCRTWTFHQCDMFLFSFIIIPPRKKPFFWTYFCFRPFISGQ